MDLVGLYSLSTITYIGAWYSWNSIEDGKKRFLWV